VTGEFVPTFPDGPKGNCKATGIKYLPKYLPPSTTTTTRGSATSTPAPTGLPYSGRGFLQAYNAGANKGCLISAGTWYTTGTCATYTASPASFGGYTLSSSKGPCAVVGTEFQCAAGLTASQFTVSREALQRYEKVLIVVSRRLMVCWHMVVAALSTLPPSQLALCSRRYTQQAMLSLSPSSGRACKKRICLYVEVN
jgi:hypothetical protein